VFSYCLYGVGLVGTVLTAGMSGWMKNRFLSNAGKYSLGIMLFHKFFIVALIRILPSSFTPSLLSVLFMTCCMTLLAMFISYFITLGVLRFCPLLLGGER
jgi:peptidoglycan/LPS O-acetylase OafA/YrhL